MAEEKRTFVLRDYQSPVTSGQALLAGAFAGFAVDMALFPLDTIKTRLQSQMGFAAAGGFRGIYSGIPAVTIGSAPGAALFFYSYEKVKKYLITHTKMNTTAAHMTAAGVGEVTACLIRVPTEVFKQRAQAAPGTSTFRLTLHAFSNEGLSVMYRGYWSTVARELPFSFIEFPLWEYLRQSWSKRQNAPVSPVQSAICGSFAGAVAAGLTTPLDVAKTRIMLSTRLNNERLTVLSVLTDVYKTKGVRGLYAGLTPRVCWMALGGFVFFGAYQLSLRLLQSPLEFDGSVASHLTYPAIRIEAIVGTMKKLFLGDDAESDNPKTFDDVIEDSRRLELAHQTAIQKHAMKMARDRTSTQSA